VNVEAVATGSESVEPASLPGAEGWLARMVRRPVLWLVLFSIPLAAQVGPLWKPSPDPIGYLSIARQIAHGQPLRRLGSPSLHYAIGYPILVAPAFWLGDYPVVAIFFINWIFAVLTIVGVYLWARRDFPQAALLLTGLVVWNASYWSMYQEPLSEIPFTAAIVWAALACRALLDARTVGSIVLWTLVSMLLVIAAATIRQVGIFVAAGYGMAALIRAIRHQSTWKRSILTTLAIGIPATASVVGLLLYYKHLAATVAGGETYVDYIRMESMTLTQQIIEAIRMRTSEIGRQVLPFMFRAYSRAGQWWNFTTLLYVAVTGVVLYGWLKLARRSTDVLVWTFPFYLGLYLVWGFDAGTRYMMPMLPVIWLSVGALVDHDHRRRLTILAVLLVLHLTTATIYCAVALPKKFELRRTLLAMEAISGPIKADPRHTVAMAMDEGNEWELLLFVVDRPIKLLKRTATPPGDTQWIITQDPSLVVGGFEPYQRAESICLLKRSK
jgi:hypothetical protein